MAGVAVRRGLCKNLEPEVAARTRTVVRHKLLAYLVRELLRDGTAQNIGWPPRRERQDETYIARRVTLSDRRAGDSKNDKRKQRTKKS